MRDAGMTEDPGQIAYQRAHTGDNRTPETIAAQTVCLVIAFLGVGLRFTERRLARATITTDDYLIILALILFIAAATIGFVCLAYGAGKHQITLTNERAFAKASFSFIVVYRPSIAAVKLSVLFFYRRIFPQASFRAILSWYGGFLLIYTAVFVLLDIFHCRPVQAAWNGESSSCLNRNTIWVVGGSLNVVTDIIALCLPLPLLWRLHVTKEKRLQLMGIFLLGGFVCIVSIIRVVELGKLFSSEDSSYAYATTIVWSSVEAGVGIFSACLPVMGPLLHTVLSMRPFKARSRDKLTRRNPGKAVLYMISVNKPITDKTAPFGRLTSAVRASDLDVKEIKEIREGEITVTTTIDQEIDTIFGESERQV